VREIRRSPRARLDLIEIWQYIYADNPAAADRALDRFESALVTLRDHPHAGRARPELAHELRSRPVGSYVLFYRPIASGIELVRVMSGYRDIQAEDMD
jgi:toxin ParE1/3/4